MRIEGLGRLFIAQLVAATFARVLLAGPKVPGGARECPVAWIEIASLKVSPSAMHVNGAQSAATVTVVVRAHGKLPSGATARVEAYTNSAEPVKNNVAYSGFLVLPLSPDLTVFRFSVRPERQTVAGTVVIRATIVGTTSGIGFYGPGGTATVPLRITAPHEAVKAPADAGVPQRIAIASSTALVSITPIFSPPAPFAAVGKQLFRPRRFLFRHWPGLKGLANARPLCAHLPARPAQR